jgi:hypothetical protein
MIRKTTTLVFCLALVVGLLGVLPVAAAPGQPGPQAAFTPGNLVIYRVGDGTSPLAGTGNPVFLDEYTTAGTLVQSLPMPTTLVGANRRLVAGGLATSEGFLTQSVDGRFLILTGYDAAIPYASSLSGTTAVTVNRVIGVVDRNGTVDITTALTDAASAGSPRSATSTNGADLWITGGTGAVRYTTLGGTTSTQLNITPTNMRQLNIFAGQMYVSTGASGGFRLAAVGSGTPTTAGQVLTNLPGFPTTTGSPYTYFFTDLDAGVSGVDTLYVADDSLNVIQKYSFVAGSWTNNGAITATSVRGLTASVSGTSVTLYATTGGSTGTGGGSLYTYADTTGYNGAVSGSATTIATAAANTAFRGIAFAPPNPLAVTLASFTAQGLSDRVLVDWVTLSEYDNAGFNLYRSDSAAGPLTLLAYVPSQGPGSSQGFAYGYEDLAVQPGQTWWYTLEDVALNGATTLHGPVSATVQAPTAVTLASVSASPAAAGSALPWLLALAAAGAALAAKRRPR